MLFFSLFFRCEFCNKTKIISCYVSWFSSLSCIVCIFFSFCFFFYFSL